MELNTAVQAALVIRGLFIFKFRICGPKWWNIATVNNEGNLYYHSLSIFSRSHAKEEDEKNTSAYIVQHRYKLTPLPPLIPWLSILDINIVSCLLRCMDTHIEQATALSHSLSEKRRSKKGKKDISEKYQAKVRFSSLEYLKEKKLNFQSLSYINITK